MRIFSLGESAITVEFSSEISLDANRRSIALAERLSETPFPGMVEAVPSYSSVTVFYDALTVRESSGGGTAHATVEAIVAKIAAEIGDPKPNDARTIEIPVEFSDAASPDLDVISQYSGMGRETAIDTFIGRTYRVYMLGFLPGFAYMGEVDERIAAPRLGTPRTKIPAGSVGIAGKQTGIYPLSSPGGWNIIGQTETKMFNAAADEPCLLRPGDSVTFYRVGRRN